MCTVVQIAHACILVMHNGLLRGAARRRILVAAAAGGRDLSAACMHACMPPRRRGLHVCRAHPARRRRVRCPPRPRPPAQISPPYLANINSVMCMWTGAHCEAKGASLRAHCLGRVAQSFSGLPDSADLSVCKVYYTKLGIFLRRASRYCLPNSCLVLTKLCRIILDPMRLVVAQPVQLL